MWHLYKGQRPRRAAATEQVKSLLLVDSFLECCTSRKLGHGGRCDLELLAGAGILACAGSAFGSLESTEADQLHILLLDNVFDDGTKQSVEGACCTCFE